MATQPQKKKPGAKAATAAGVSPAAKPAKESGASPFPGKPNNPAGVGNQPFMAAPGLNKGLNPPLFNMPPFGPPMPNTMSLPQSMMPPQGIMPPQGMIPPPGFGAIPAAFASGELFNSLGNMLRLGIDTINAALAGSNQLMQGFTGGGQIHNPQPQYPQGCGCRGHMQHCCGHYYQRNTYHESGCHSCCDVYGESCCNPSVHNCC